MIRSRYNLGERVGAVKFTAPTLCQTQFKASTSVDEMIRRAVLGDRSVFGSPRFLDCLAAPESFHEALNKSAMAQSVWNDLPDSVKASYGSPERLIQEYDSMVAASRSASPAAADDVSETPPVDGVTGGKPAEPSNGSAPAQTT